jgi:hypothetical protein
MCCFDWFDVWLIFLIHIFVIVKTDLRGQRLYILCWSATIERNQKGEVMVSMVGISTVYNKRIADQLLEQLAEEICKILTSKACPWLNAGNDERMR